MHTLFSDTFLPADKSQWLAQAQKDLKDPNRTAEALYESLRWATLEGFTVEPYFTAEDLQNLPLQTIQAAQKMVPGWLNTPEVKVADEKATNEQLRTNLRRGADAVVLNLMGLASEQTDLARLLNGIKLSDTPVYFRTDGAVDKWLTQLTRIAPYQLKGGLVYDPLAYWVTTGMPYEEGVTLIVNATRVALNSPQFRTVTVSSHAFHNAGATATQELASLLATLADVYDNLTETGLTPEELVSKTMLSVSVGTSYFLEIAKLRALRVLYNRILSAYITSSSTLPTVVTDHSCFIHAQTSAFYAAAATPYTNLLRGTTEAMAAVIGGCDALTVYPYNAVLEKPNEFAERIARNVSVLLKEETHLDKVADPSAGSYYVEALTYQLVEAAWKLFLQVEEQGGFSQSFRRGFIQQQIDQAYRAKVDALKAGQVMVGVNRFRHDEVPIQQPKLANLAPQDTQWPLLPQRRLAETFE